MKILIIEDEVKLLEALKEILIQNNYIVDGVSDGISGLDYSLSGIYDVILLDIMLPKLNGIEVLKALRKEKIKTPVLLLTAKSEIKDKVVGLDSGADDYLTKPFSTEELLARIRALGRRQEDIIGSTLEFNDLILDLASYSIFCNENSLKLGLKEFQIMELFMTTKTQILSKELIIQKVWGYEMDVEYNNVEVYISFIRKKLLYLKSKVEIKTSRGVGYYLEEKND